jgi:hypothetical protein
MIDDRARATTKPAAIGKRFAKDSVNARERGSCANGAYDHPMTSIYLALNAAEFEALAAVLARIAIDGEESEATREVATKTLKELERARVSDAIRRRKGR